MLTNFVEKMDEFCKSPVLSWTLFLNFSTLHCREAVYDIRLWQMSPDGTLTLILPHSSFLFILVLCTSKCSVLKRHALWWNSIYRFSLEAIDSVVCVWW